ncbi:MAG TPA: ABC transporter substrate binding protein, partial [Candidatus Binatia bacterium]
RFAGGDPERLRSLAEELVHLNVDLIVTSGSTATRPAKQATAAIPIVMTQDPDPVGNGFVSSLARPGGNITGLSNLNRELKQIEIAAGPLRIQCDISIVRLSRISKRHSARQPSWVLKAFSP